MKITKKEIENLVLKEFASLLDETRDPAIWAAVRELRKRLAAATAEVATNVRLSDDAADQLVTMVLERDTEGIEKLLEGLMSGLRNYRESLRLSEDTNKEE